MAHGWTPETDSGEARARGDARYEEVRLQCRSEFGRRPTAQRAVDGQRRPIHAVRAAQHARAETGAQQPSAVPLIETHTRPTSQPVERNADDDRPEEQVDHSIARLLEQEHAKWKADERRADEPPRVTQVDVAPIPRD